MPEGVNSVEDIANTNTNVESVHSQNTVSVTASHFNVQCGVNHCYCHELFRFWVVTQQWRWQVYRRIWVNTETRNETKIAERERLSKAASWLRNTKHTMLLTQQRKQSMREECWDPNWRHSTYDNLVKPESWTPEHEFSTLDIICVTWALWKMDINRELPASYSILYCPCVTFYLNSFTAKASSHLIPWQLFKVFISVSSCQNKLSTTLNDCLIIIATAKQGWFLSSYCRNISFYQSFPQRSHARKF